MIRHWNPRAYEPNDRVVFGGQTYVASNRFYSNNIQQEILRGLWVLENDADARIVTVERNTEQALDEKPNTEDLGDLAFEDEVNLSKTTISDTSIGIGSSQGTGIEILSGTDLKTVNGNSLIGSGDIAVGVSGAELSGYAARPRVGAYLPVIPFRALTGLFIQSNDRKIWQPFDVPFDCEIDELKLEVSGGAAASQSAIIAIYANNPATNEPSTVLVKDAVSLATTGVKTLSFSAISLTGDNRRLWVYRWSTAGSGGVILFGPSSTQILANSINSASFANNNSVLTIPATYPASDADALVDTIDNPTGLVESGLNTLQYGARISSIL